jgi:hypothetical protein
VERIGASSIAALTHHADQREQITSRGEQIFPPPNAVRLSWASWEVILLYPEYTEKLMQVAALQRFHQHRNCANFSERRR